MADHIKKAISAFFIGPHAENMQFFRHAIDAILDELQAARERYAPNDSIAITQNTHFSEEFQSTSNRLASLIHNAVQMLSTHSIPFWSPRYSAHMCPDLAMPAMLGYFMGMLWNPNNVTVEVSPFTTSIEQEVGRQFCELFGYNTHPEKSPVGWGHVTSGGTVANIEAIWVARNLKFYPLTLRRAIEEGELEFLAEGFAIETCEGTWKKFCLLSTWELLNLKPRTILDLPNILFREYELSRDQLERTLLPYNIQCTGKEELERYFEVEKPCQIVIGKSYHYSWVKGAAITGIGSNHVVSIGLDNHARVDLSCLEKHLQHCLETHQAVYAVVAIIGSTEEGSVDQLSEIIKMRERFQEKGLSFLVHADAAWGGYFATMLPDGTDDGLSDGLNLRSETARDIAALEYADSITVDPHKAGYIPYPAGGLAYRDERMRNLVAWTSSYLSQGSEDSMGIYGIEGSKPGAAAMAIWLAHQAIGLNYHGYGAILRQVSFNRAMISATWATMTTANDSFILVPFDMLPSEQIASFTTINVELEKDRIRKEILGKSYEEISASDDGKPLEQRTMTLLHQLGSELNINAFAINWRHRDGSINIDTSEANNLMRRIIKRLSVNSVRDDPFKIPLYLTSTEFPVERYGRCVATFKARLQLKPSNESLFVLRNVVMSPFAGQGAPFQSMMAAFRTIVEEEVEASRRLHDASMCSECLTCFS